MKVQIDLSNCPPTFLDELLLDPCLFLSNIPVVLNCSMEKEKLVVGFRKPVEHSIQYNLVTGIKGWALYFEKIIEGKPGAYLSLLALLYLGGSFFRVEFETSGRLFARKSLLRDYATLFESYNSLAGERCRKITVSTSLTIPKPVGKPKKPFWEGLPEKIDTDLSLTLVRASLLRDIEKTYVTDGVPYSDYFAHIISKGKYMVVIVYTGGREYLFISDGVIRGRYLEGARGVVVHTIVYKLKG
ncbi:hypothetical protein ACSU1N_06995 [Thermogladius sp. 4427co]|uniref:hypothetical protein n=1 Tax=Thermogladius sp. 4427co TaxID=3450718 RepID=UPI003F79C57C